MALNYNHLYYFHVAALEGSVAAAAQRLGVTAATVSEQLRTLERSLGHDLFERTQSGLRLTDAGRITFEHTLPMFRVGDRLQHQLGNGAGRPLPSLRIGISMAIARTAMVHLIAPLFQLAECVPAIRTSEHVELLRDLKNGGLDLVLCESMPDEVATRNMQVVEVARMPLVAIAAPGFKPAADWRDARFVHYRPTTPFRGDVETFLSNNSLTPMFGGEADDGLVLVEAAAQPGNIAIVPRALAHDAIEAGRVAVLRDVEPSSSAIHALFPDTAHAKRAVDLLRKSAAR